MTLIILGCCLWLSGGLFSRDSHVTSIKPSPATFGSTATSEASIPTASTGASYTADSQPVAFTASSAANSYYSNVLGLAFSYPAFLGPIIEATGTNLDNQLQDFISFGSTTSAINFWSVNSSTDFYDSQENLFTYSGAAVDGTCSEMNGFDTIDYSVQLTKCNIEQVNETKLAEFEGRYSPLAFIGSDAGSSRFAGAFVQTCSRSWPGLIIFVDENDDARNYQRNVEGLITIVDSISYPSSSQCYSGAGVSY